MNGYGDQPLGSEYARPQWDSNAQNELVRRFFESGHGRSLDFPDRRRLLRTIIRYAIYWCKDDPLLWRPDKVVALFRWITSNVPVEVHYLDLLPPLLRAFIRFGHEEFGARPYQTRRAMEAIDRAEPGFQDRIRSVFSRWGYESGTGCRVLDGMCAMVGGLAQLRRLDAEPLPDIPFDWTGVPDDIHAAVEQILALTDRCCEDMFDTEYRTACRRMLARAASIGPCAFRGRVRVEISAAAVVMTVCETNGLLASAGFLARPERLRVKDLTSYFGIRSGLSDRASTLLGAMGGQHYDERSPLDSPDFLVAASRRRLIDLLPSYLDEPIAVDGDITLSYEDGADPDPSARRGYEDEIAADGAAAWPQYGGRSARDSA